MSKEYKWRTINANAVYVDSDMGSDVDGDGTMSKPFQTLGKAWRGMVTVPSTIICRGRFTEDMADGNHSAAINGDYYGAAVFDGNDEYLIYGFTHNNMQIKNCCIPTYGLVINSGSYLLAGVGRALNAPHAGNAYHVLGVAGAPTLIEKSPLHHGAIGGNSAVTRQVVASPKWIPEYKLWFGSYSGSQVLRYNTYYNIPKESRIKTSSRNNNRNTDFTDCLFAKVALYIDDPMIFTRSLFTSDCEWITATGEVVEINGVTSEEREASLRAKMDELGVAESNRPNIRYCRFTTQTSAEVLNDPEHGDYTVKIGSDGQMSERAYFGALPPALPVRIMDNSDGVAETWDEKSVSGILAVDGNKICLNDVTETNIGDIYSKVVRIDERKVWLNGVYAQFSSVFAHQKIHLSEADTLGETIEPGDVMSEGVYMTTGNIIFDDNEYSAGCVIFANEGDTYQIDDEDENAGKLKVVNDPNINNVCYLRTTPVIYRKIKADEGLERGGVYLNYGLSNITYRGKTIVPNESFVADNDVDTFVGPDEDYTIGIMFDDTRVPSQEWIPAQMFGEYFVWKDKGVVKLDNEDIPISSGNYLSYQTTANGGYSQQLKKTNMSDRYCQFRIFVKREL